MITELSTAIVTKYNTLQYNGKDLSSTAPIFADIGTENGEFRKNYPFVVYTLVGDAIDFSTCSDFHQVLIQMSVFDNLPTLGRISAIADVVLDGFNETSLTGLDGTQLKLEPVNVVRNYSYEEFGWQISIDFVIEIEKTR
jgi:hypothetical protein